MKITVDPNWHGSGYLGFLILNDRNDETILVQSDYEYAGVASNFGWIPCECGATDGTVACASCKRDVATMIAEAEEKLLQVGRDETWVEDPGYFPEPTYKIVRMYQGDREKETIATGLTLQEARDWCRHPETSWKTCSSPEGKRRTEVFGPWFDGFEEELRLGPLARGPGLSVV